MTHLLNRFSLQAEKWNSAVTLALLFIWIAVIGCVVSSILSQPFDRRQRLFWIAAVVFLPGIGLLAYLPFAFHKEDLPHMFQRKPKHSKKRKDSSSAADTNG